MQALKNILLVEDNPDDELLMLDALADNRIENTVIVARDGEEALDYLFAKGPHQGRNKRDLPAIVLLDLKLPKLSGLDVLREIRQNPITRHQPVTILTSSDEEEDLTSSYALGVNSYIRKPVDYDDFVETAGQIGRYWLELNHGPPESAT